MIKNFVRVVLGKGPVFKGLARGALALLAVACATDKSEPTIAAIPEAPSEPVYMLADITDASPARLDEVFGPPALTRREGDGEFRRYALRNCMIIVILYPNDEDVTRVSHVDATALQLGQPKPDLERCLALG